MTDSEQGRVTLYLGKLYRPAAVAVDELGFGNIQRLCHEAVRSYLEAKRQLKKGIEDEGDS